MFSSREPGLVLYTDFSSEIKPIAVAVLELKTWGQRGAQRGHSGGGGEAAGLACFSS